jgi:hypothetical protein
MNQEEREAITHKTIQRIVSGLQQPTNVEEMIGSILTGYGVAMFAAQVFSLERWRQQGPDGSAHGAGLAHLQEVPSRGTHDRRARGEQE